MTQCTWQYIKTAPLKLESVCSYYNMAAGNGLLLLVLVYLQIKHKAWTLLFVKQGTTAWTEKVSEFILWQQPWVWRCLNGMSGLVGKPCPQRDFSVSTVGPVLSVRKHFSTGHFYCCDFCIHHLSCGIQIHKGLLFGSLARAWSFAKLSCKLK